MTADLRKIKNPVLVQEVLDEITQKKMYTEVWQPIGSNRKLILEAKILRLTPYELFLVSKSSFEKFDATIPTYCHIPQKLTVFKSEINFLSKFKMALNYPDYLIHKELRELERKDIMKFKYTVSYKFGLNNLKLTEPGHGARLINYNSKGLALQVSKAIIQNFYLGDHLSLKIPGQQPIVRNGEIKHITPTDNNHVTLGLQLL